ncbi:ABC transporter ATP-binding protein [Sorangium sp. So ce1153]|uniref:ABC transporter ATP-binding protein n=1 Tax=Sorangium sp. So ce1153 TaxID=3133333 RepID=UPI003F612F30
MAEASSAIAVESLSKTYQVHERAAGFAATVRSVFRRRTRVVHAVEDLSFSIAPGERVGFLGPNGAGKTTTLKVLAGLLHPTGGRVRVAGSVPQHREADFLKRITLVMGQKQQLLWDLPPAETFALNRAIYGIGDAEFRQTLGELEDLLGIAVIASKPTRQLSLGERMKCELAAALLHRPEILFLDEPTIGLDVAMQLSVREFIRRYNEQRGATIVLTSHYMDDVAALCPRVIVIDKGRLRYDGDLAALARSVRPHKRIALRFGGVVDRALLERVGAVLSLDAGRAVLQVRQEELRQAMSWLLSQTDIADLTVEDPPLEEVMRELFAGEEPAGESSAAAGAPAAAAGGAAS